MNTSRSLRAIDLNLLVVFDGLMTELSVTRAANRLGMSQPAVSNALLRLRQLLDDRLFVRGGDGIKPTLKAVALAEPVREALATIEAALMPSRFVPAEAHGTFYLSLSDHTNLCVLPLIAERVSAVAPGIRLECMPKALPTLPNLLEKNQVDIALGIFSDIPARLQSEVLFREGYTCVMPAGHPLQNGPLTLPRLIEHPQLLLRSAQGARPLFDQVLAEKDLRRHVVVTSVQAGVIPRIVRECGLVVCLLERTLDFLPPAAFDGVIMRPIDGISAEIKMIWHASTSENVQTMWLRDQIREVTARFRAVDTV